MYCLLGMHYRSIRINLSTDFYPIIKLSPPNIDKIYVFYMGQSPETMQKIKKLKKNTLHKKKCFKSA